MCPVSYNATVMFTSTLVRSHLDSRRRWGEHRVGCGNKMHAREERPEWGSVHAWNEAMKDVFARCHKKTAVQVSTLTIMHCCLITVNTHIMICMCYYLTLAAYPCHPCLWLIHNTNWCLFSQVKNKPWHTWVYTWFWHHPEQFQISPLAQMGPVWPKS